MIFLFTKLVPYFISHYCLLRIFAENLRNDLKTLLYLIKTIVTPKRRKKLSARIKNNYFRLGWPWALLIKIACTSRVFRLIQLNTPVHPRYIRYNSFRYLSLLYWKIQIIEIYIYACTMKCTRKIFQHRDEKVNLNVNYFHNVYVSSYASVFCVHTGLRAGPRGSIN